MSDTIRNYFLNAQLANASYLKLNDGLLTEEYINVLEDDRFSKTEAQEFVKRYKVIDDQQDTDAGFSATLFQENTTDEYTLAIRGTDPTFPSIFNDLITDFFDIGTDGIALHQAKDLFNYYQKLITPLNGDAMQISIYEGGSPPNNGVPFKVIGSVGNDGREVYRYLEVVESEGGLGKIPTTAKINVTGHSLGGHLALILSRFDPDHINQVYTFNAPGFDAEIIGTSETEWFFKAVGYAQTQEQLSTTVAKQFPDTKLNNLIIPQDVVSDAGEVPNGQIVQFGEHENTTNPLKLLDAHSVQGMSDVLAVSSLFNALSPGSSLEQTSSIIRRSSYNLKNDLEQTINTLGDLLGFGVPVGIKNRESLHLRIQEISHNIFVDPNDLSPALKPQYQGMGLLDLSTHVTDGVIEANAKVSIAYRYALKHLTPFVFIGDGAATIYESHNAQGELELYDPETGLGMTDEYIEDRAKFLTVSMFANEVNSPSVTGNESIQFTDQTTVISVDIHNSSSDETVQLIKFGSEQLNDIVTGASGKDRLYGGGGNDSLYGYDGEDYLEGGAGKDRLFGGEGKDILKGGFDYDYYYSGNLDIITDSDGRGEVQLFDGTNQIYLTGGIHHDGDPANVYRSADESITYTLNGSTLTVTAGQETLEITDYSKGFLSGTSDYYLSINLDDGLPPTGGTPQVFNVDLSNPPAKDGRSISEYKKEFGFFDINRFSETPDISPENGWLSATAAEETIISDEIHISGTFVNGFFTHKISGGPGDSIIYGSNSDNRIVDYAQSNYDFNKDPRALQDVGNGDQDILYGYGGDDWLHSSYGNDQLYGGEGNDWLTSTASWGGNPNLPAMADWLAESEQHQTRDRLYGEAGNDVLASHFDKNYLDGGTGNDHLYAGSDDDVLSGGDGDDILFGDVYFSKNPLDVKVTDPLGPNYSVEYNISNENKLSNDNETYGNDSLSGGEGDDYLYGGGGNDSLDGGTGNDKLHGDAITITNVNDTPFSIHGNDTLFGGEGADLLIGDGGDDTLFGGTGNDELWGDNGNLDGQDHGNDFLMGDDGDDQISGQGGDDILLGGNGNDHLFGDSEEISGKHHGKDELLGGNGDDYLKGGGNDDVLAGGAGNDNLFGDGASVATQYHGDDILSGGKGTDNLIGGEGNDTYIYNKGDGEDFIWDSAGNNDVLKLRGFNSNDVELYRQDNQLNIFSNLDNGYIVVNDFFSSDSIDSIEFGNGIIWNRADILQNILDISGSEDDDILEGNNENNIISAGAGNDILTGHAGNDTLEGGAGNDSYIFNLGDGEDVIIDSSGESDRLVFGAGISGSNLKITEDGTNLTISFSNNDAQIQIVNWFNSNEQIETFEFEDGTVWDEDIIRSKIGLPVLVSDTLLASKNNTRLINATELLANDVSSNNQTLSIDSVTDAINGTVTFDQVNNQVIFIPVADFLGVASFNYSVSDGNGGSVSTTVTLDVVENSAPELTSPTSFTLDEDTSLTIFETELRAQYSDADGDALSISQLNIGQGEGFIVNNKDGTWRYTPPSNFNGTINLSYQVSDGKVLFEATTTISVLAVNDELVALSSQILVPTDQVAKGFLTAEDSDNSTNNLSFSLENDPENGSIEIKPDGSYIYTPDSAFEGSDSFRFTVTNIDGVSSTSDVFINVGDPDKEFLVNTSTDGSQARQAVTRLADGGFIVVWSSSGGNSPGIFGQLYNAAGTPVGSETKINSTNTGSFLDFKSAPDVAVRSDGEIFISWSVANQDGNGLGVYARRFDTSFTPKDNEFQINTTTQNDQSSTSIDFLTDGSSVISWTSNSQDGSNKGVYGQRYNPDGSTAGSEFQINSFTQGNQSNDYIIALTDGGFLAGWSSHGQDGDSYGVFAQRYDELGRTVGSEFQVNSYTESWQRYSSAIATSDGGFIIAWMSLLPNGGEVFAQRFDPLGSPVGNEFQVSTSEGDQNGPEIAMLNDGGFIITWHSEGMGRYAGGNDSTVDGVFGQRFDANFIPLGEEFQVNASITGSQRNAAISSLSSGGVVMTWTSWDRYSQDSSSQGVYARVYSNPELTSSSGNDVLIGGENDDFLLGLGGNDRIQGGKGNDFIDGGNGNDSAIFSGNKSDYKINAYENDEFLDDFDSINDFIDNIYYIVHDQRGIDGIDRLFGIESLIFNDTAVDNTRPVANDEIINILENHNQTIVPADLLANDTDADGNSLQITAIGNSINGKVSFDADGNIGFTPDFNFNGFASFDYQVDDGQNGRSIATVTFKVASIEPDRVIQLPVDENVTGLIGNNINVDNHSYSIFEAPDNGTVELNPDGTYTYSPDEGYQGTDKFMVLGTDTNGATSSNEVHVRVGDNEVWDGPEFVVNSNAYDKSEGNNAPTSIRLSAGGFVTLWQRNSATIGQLFDSHGSTIGDEFLIVSSPTYFRPTPSISAAIDGGFFVSWETPANSNNTLTNIQIQHFDALATPTGVTQLVNVGPSGHEDVTELPSGKYVVSWVKEDKFRNYKLWSKIYDSEGAPDSEKFMVNPANGAFEYSDNDQSRIVALTNDEFMVVWHSNAIADNIYGQRFNNQGEKLGSYFQIDSSLEYELSSFDVSATYDGGFVVSWVHDRSQSGIDDKILFRVYDNNGVPSTDEIIVVNSFNEIQQGEEVTVTGLPAGDFIVTWNTVSENRNTVLKGQRYEASGTPKESTFVINNHLSDSAYWSSPSYLVALSDSEFAVVWEGELEGGALVGSASKDSSLPGAYARAIFTKIYSESSIIGTSGNDILVASNENDIIYSNKGNDRLTGGRGDDLIDGGDGDDVAIFSGVESDYEVTQNEDGSTTVRDLRGIDGTDTLFGIETLVFSDSTSTENISPVANDDIFTTVEDNSLTIAISDLLSNDTDADNDTLSISSVGNPLNGQVTLETNGSISFVPNANFNGTASFDYTVTDGNGGTSTASVTVNVAPVNDAPTLAQALIDQSIKQGQLLTYQLANNTFTDIDGDSLNITATLADGSALPSWLSFDTVTGTFSGTPESSDVGSLAIRVTANDPDGLAISDDFALSISNQANTAPSAMADSVNTTEDQTLIITSAELLANDTDVDNDTLSISSVSNPLNGQVTLATDGSISFVPTANFNGTASFDYTVTDGNGGTSTTSATVNVASINDAPTLTQALADQSVTEGQLLTYQFANNTFTDIDGDSLNITASLADGSALPTWLSFDATTGTFSGTPEGANVGSLSIRVIASDPDGLNSSDEFVLNVLNTSIPKTFVGTDGDDIFYGNDDDEVIDGRAGNDALHGNKGDDIIDGGTGNDHLYGESNQWNGAGNDTYLLKRGGGHDTVYDADDTAGNIDTILVAADISPTDIELRHYIATQDLLVKIIGSEDSIRVNDWFDGNDFHIEQIKFEADGTIWNESIMSQAIITGTDGDDIFYGTDDDEIIDGRAGSDSLHGNKGDDIIDGGTGNDLLYGENNQWNGAGNDTYLLKRGGGHDTVYDADDTAGNLDTILVAADISPSDIELRHDMATQDLIIKVIGSEDSIRVNDWFDGTDFHIEQIKFEADGTIWNESVMSQAIITGSDNDDVFYGNEDNNIIEGGAGVDTLYGNKGDDIIDGGTGNDLLYGENNQWNGAGNDTYLLKRGGGHDTVYDADDTAGNLDTILVAADISPADIELRHDMATQDLIIKIIGSEDSIRVNDWFDGTDFHIEQIKFEADGTIWNESVISQAIITGSDGDDTLIGSSNNDTLEGLEGDDVLLGGDGDDEYLIKRNHGDSTIVDTQGNDEITFGSDIAHDQLWFARVGDSLKVSVVGGNSSATISDWYTDSTQVIETINVSDAQIQAGNQLDQLVTAMAAFNPPASGAMQISDEARDSLAPVLAASWGVS